jgi:hypothetical protein
LVSGVILDPPILLAISIAMITIAFIIHRPSFLYFPNRSYQKRS